MSVLIFITLGLSSGAVWYLLSSSAADNSRIVSGGADRLVMLTDVSTGKPIRKYRGHISVSESLCVSATYVHATPGQLTLPHSGEHVHAE